MLGLYRSDDWVPAGDRTFSLQLQVQVSLKTLLKNTLLLCSSFLVL